MLLEVIFKHFASYYFHTYLFNVLSTNKMECLFFIQTVSYQKNKTEKLIEEMTVTATNIFQVLKFDLPGVGV